MASRGRHGGQQMNGYGLDTNIVSFRVKGSLIIKRHIERVLQSDTKIVIPCFAYYEVKRGLLDANARKQMQSLDELLEQCPLGQALDNEIYEEASRIWVKLKQAGFRTDDDIDVLIAAFCKVYGLTLVTNNTKHFENIDGLVLEDWSFS
jgi:predicted nucleic acid-binding protein